MTSLKDLIAQREALDRQIESTQQQQRADAVAKVRELMAEHGLTAADLGTKANPKPAKGSGTKVAAKYRNAATGDAWSGRGLQPKWLKAALASGRKLSEFTL
jgi:DNA-binding protein H-NS